MSQITIEAIEKILDEVPGATYKQAKKALIENDGDVIGAIIDLEDELGKSKTLFGKDKDELKEQAIDLIKKSTVVKIKIEKDGKTILNVPVAVGVAGAIIGPMAMLFGLSAAILSKSQIKISNEETELDLGEFTQEKFSLIKDLVSGKIKEAKEVKEKDTVKEKFAEEEVKEIVINMKKDEE